MLPSSNRMHFESVLVPRWKGSFLLAVTETDSNCGCSPLPVCEVQLMLPLVLKALVMFSTKKPGKKVFLLLFPITDPWDKLRGISAVSAGLTELTIRAGSNCKMFSCLKGDTVCWIPSYEVQSYMHPSHRGMTDLLHLKPHNTSKKLLCASSV